MNSEKIETMNSEKKKILNIEELIKTINPFKF